ncbi:MAG TPA: CoA ester lyase [Steroidobacteraceae bacterium]|nr:CoA ester lyase [Steroidobacteraceae bacterium]
MSEQARGAALRSWLFVPGDSARKQEKALATDADALILDLEDSVDPAQLPAARAQVSGLLQAHPAGAGPELWVRINAPSGAAWRADLQAVFGLAHGGRGGAGAGGGRTPDGVVLPKVSAPAEIVSVAGHLATLEARGGGAGRVTRLLIIATETPAGLLALPQYPAVLGSSRVVMTHLAGLTWGAEDLGTALGALGRRDSAGALTFSFQLARSTCLLAAAALGVQAIDGVQADFRDARGLEAELTAARRDGFSGKLAIHPDQIGAINAAFTPTEAEREHARRVVAAFAGAGTGGVASLDGQMIDRPHLIQAQRVLAAPAARPKRASG